MIFRNPHNFKVVLGNIINFNWTSFFVLESSVLLLILVAMTVLGYYWESIIHGCKCCDDDCCWIMNNEIKKLLNFTKFFAAKQRYVPLTKRLWIKIERIRFFSIFIFLCLILYYLRIKSERMGKRDEEQKGTERERRKERQKNIND